MSEIKQAKNFVIAPYEVLEVLPNNPRTELGDIPALAASIKGSGRIITPLKGFERDGKIMIADGQRRMKALEMLLSDFEAQAILENIPVEILTGQTDEVTLSFLQMQSNEGLELSPLEQAERIALLVSSWDLKTAEIAEKLGKSTVYINQLKKIGELPEYVKAAIRKGTISVTLIRQQIAAGTLDEFISQLNLDETTEGEDAGEGVVIGEKKITAKNTNAKNSVRDFRKFMKVFSEVFTNAEAQRKYEFVKAIVNNELDYAQIQNEFVTDKNRQKAFTSTTATESQKSEEKQESKKEAPKKEAVKPIEAEKPEAPKKQAKTAPKKETEGKGSPETKKGKDKDAAKKEAPKKGARVIGFDKKAETTNV